MTAGREHLSPWSSDGIEIDWDTWDGTHAEHLEARWQNEAWTVEGTVDAHRIQYVLRLSAMFQPRQFLLFRDLDDADLWLATDGAGRWGEVNGAHRPDLDGCTDIGLDCTPFTHTMPIRRLPLEVGHTAQLAVAMVDPETLAVVPTRVQYTRTSERAWHVAREDRSVELLVDDTGLVVDEIGRYRRSTMA